MTTSLNLILLPLYRLNDRDQAELPGLKAAQAPRRPARGRSADLLVIHLALEGTAPLSAKGYDKLVSHLMDVYYRTPGSSTAAMRTIAEWLNEYLVERNQRGASRSMQSVGYLTLAVVRGTHLYLAQCGPTHTYLVSSRGVTHYLESDISKPGLGLGRVTHIRYHQVEISPNDLLLISANPPPIWTTAFLNGLHGLSLDRVHLSLLHQIGPELQAGLIQITTGSGKVKALRPELVAADQQVTSGDVQEDSSGLEKAGVRSQDAPQASRTQAVKPSPIPTSIEGTQTSPSESEPVLASPPVQVTPVETGHTEGKVESRRERMVGPALLKLGSVFKDAFTQAGRGIGRLATRMLPDESLLSLPTSVMAFIAVAVPIVVVAVAATVYMQRGQDKMYQEQFLQARYAAEQALQLTEPQDLREAWNTVLSYLNEAEAYKITPDSQSMRDYADSVLDNLDLIVRLPFQPLLVDSLPNDAKITRIVAAEGDNVLYLLNATDGHVYRATRSDRGFELDPNFICEPVPKPLIVGKLVDIVPMPLDDPNNAVIMGMDENGNQMQCIPNGQPPLTLQMSAPDMNWGTPKAFELNAMGLYVLDPLTNAVWIYWASDSYQERPTLFFDDHVPPMGDVIDLTLNKDDLYLLHANGTLTTCTFGYPTRCEDQAMIKDRRQGGTSSPRMDGVTFGEIQFASPPDPSLYLLEPENNAIFHFSVRLTYQRQYRPATPILDGSATAFTVSANHQVFMAAGNQVYYAPLP